MRLPLPARVYVCVVIALGVVTLGSVLPLLEFPRPILFVTLLALSVVSSAV